MHRKFVLVTVIFLLITRINDGNALITCPEGQWKQGTDCVHCNCRDSSEICNRANGLCNSGCPDGKKPPNCVNDCPDHHYGKNCKMECNCLNITEVCEKSTGNCESGCPKNREGANCARISKKTALGALTKLLIVGGAVLAVAVFIGLAVVAYRKFTRKDDIDLNDPTLGAVGSRASIIARRASQLGAAGGRRRSSLMMSQADMRRASVLMRGSRASLMARSRQALPTAMPTQQAAQPPVQPPEQPQLPSEQPYVQPEQPYVQPEQPYAQQPDETPNYDDVSREDAGVQPSRRRSKKKSKAKKNLDVEADAEDDKTEDVTARKKKGKKKKKKGDDEEGKKEGDAEYYLFL